MFSRCTNCGQYVQYKEGYWVGLVDDVFTILPCPFGYCSCPSLPQQDGTATTGCFYNAINGSDVCANNRAGILCGECQDNFTVGIPTFRCVPREQSTACTFTTIFSFIFTLLLCILILYFNPGLDNEFRGPLFFFQVLPLFLPPFQYTKKSIPVNVYNFAFFLSSIFNFTLPFFGYFFSHCYIMVGMDNLYMLVWGYSSPVIALLVFCVAFLLSYKRLILIRRKNAVQCFWVLLILMYSSLMQTSLSLVNCLPIQGTYRLFLQASVTCHQARYIGLLVVACFILLGGLIIPLMIFISTQTNRLNLAPYYLDTLTNKLKEGRAFWWSVDLLRRFFVVALGNLIPILQEKQVYTVLRYYGTIKSREGGFTHLNTTLMVQYLHWLHILKF